MRQAALLDFLLLVRHPQIPPQTRVLLPIDLTPIELAYYDSTFSRGLDELHFDVDGNGFDLSVGLARYWVQVLRRESPCCTLRVGRLTRPALLFLIGRDLYSSTNWRPGAGA